MFLRAGICSWGPEYVLERAGICSWGSKYIPEGQTMFLRAGICSWEGRNMFQRAGICSWGAGICSWVPEYVPEGRKCSWVPEYVPEGRNMFLGTEICSWGPEYVLRDRNMFMRAGMIDCFYPKKNCVVVESTIYVYWYWSVLYLNIWKGTSKTPILWTLNINVQGVPHHIRPRADLNYDFRD